MRLSYGVKAGVFGLLVGAMAASWGWADPFTETSSTHFIIYSKDIPEDFIDSVIEYAERYYNELTEKLGFRRFNYWTWESRARIYIYPDRETFAREQNSPAWVGGLASYADKTIWTFPREAGFFDSLLPHEIGHIVFREVIGAHEIPAWLEEGVASYLEPAKRIGAERIVFNALQDHSFIPFDQLNGIDENTLRTHQKVELFYAEAISLVKYLIENFGIDAFNDFCEKLRDGKRLDKALCFAYFDIRSAADLGKLWEESLRRQTKSKNRMVL